MKKIFIASAIFITSGSLITLSKANQVKPSITAASTIAASVKLAEAKAVLSKANTRNLKSNLGTADGGI
ncbi:hypothetical protein ACFQ3S_04350 [Mucilaginibacter terrae]|uniref:hypothetical protein n=1 Tax=Mucilaginibacter terrae TaxID=1955052 RepID=UPI00363F1BD3